MQQSQELEKEKDKDLLRRFRVHLSANNLKNTDTLSLSDPFCKVFLQHSQDVQQEYLGQTEVIKDNLCPKWDKFFEVFYLYERNQTLSFQIWDLDQSTGSQNEMIGQATITIKNVVDSKNQTLITPLKLGKDVVTGFLTIHFEDIIEDNRYIKWVWGGKKLINTDGVFGKSDPFLRFYKKSKLDDNWYLVKQLEIIKNNLNPTWNQFEITSEDLCNGNYDQNFKVECWDDHEKGLSNHYMGSFETNLSDIIKNNKVEFNLDLNGKSGGTIAILWQEHEYRPIYSDYIKDGGKTNVFVGIDFSDYNGEQNYPTSLHYNDPQKEQEDNEYINAFKAFKDIIKLFEGGKKFPVYGFSAVPHLPNFHSNDVEYCFPLTGNFKQPEVKNVKELIELYRAALINIEFSNPAQISDILEYTKKVCEKNKAKNIYVVLIVFTCGQFDDYPRAVQLVEQCQLVPISIIFVGLGDLSFTKIENIFAEVNKPDKRQFFSFVNLKLYKDNFIQLKRELHLGLIAQILEYKKRAEKQPIKKNI